MEKSGKIPNDITEIWEAIKVLDKRSKQFIDNLWKVQKKSIKIIVV